MKLKPLLALALVVGSGVVLANSCPGAGDQVSVRSCNEFQATQAAEAVGKAEDQLQSVIKSWKDGKDVQENMLSRLAEISQSYAHYRKASCAFVADEALAGNGAKDMQLVCERDLDQSYVSFLQTRMQELRN